MRIYCAELLPITKRDNFLVGSTGSGFRYPPSLAPDGETCGVGVAA